MPVAMPMGGPRVRGTIRFEAQRAQSEIVLALSVSEHRQDKKLGNHVSPDLLGIIGRQRCGVASIGLRHPCGLIDEIHRFGAWFLIQFL